MNLTTHSNMTTHLNFYYDNTDFNPWIGFVTITEEGTRDRVIGAVTTAMDSFWRSFDEDDPRCDSDICYGECVVEELDKLGIPYELIYKPDTDDCFYSDYDDEWENFTCRLKCEDVYLGSPLL